MSLTGTDYAPDTRVFFGGSFLPPHVGHDGILERLCSEHEVSHVHVVPTGVNPLKDNDNGFSSKEKEILVDAWLADFRLRHRVLAQKIVFETFELESPKPSFSVNSIEKLKNAHADRWVLAMGADLVQDLNKWKSIHELLSFLSGVWVFQRGGYEINPSLVPEDLRALSTWRFFPEKLPWVSSTQMRESITSLDAMRASLEPYLVPGVFDVFSRLLIDKNRE